MQATKKGKTAPMPQTPCTRDQLAYQAKQSAEINSHRPKFTDGSAAKAK